MRYCFSFVSAIFFLDVVMCNNVMYSTAGAEAAASAATENPWYWISSDNNYTKYYNTSQVRVQEAFGGIATKITAVTKTTYSYGGAKETLDN